MTCRTVGSAIVCGPPPGVYHRRILRCGACDRRHRFVIRWDGAWYGTTLYGACGDRWQDGEMAPRPFKRGWREEAQGVARAMWLNAAPKGLYDAYVDADMRLAMGDGRDFEKVCADLDAALAAITERATA